MRRFDVTAQDGMTLTAEPDAPSAGPVRGPRLVETYPVSVEGTYLVVDLDTRQARAPA